MNYYNNLKYCFLFENIFKWNYSCDGHYSSLQCHMILLLSPQEPFSIFSIVENSFPVVFKYNLI